MVKTPSQKWNARIAKYKDQSRKITGVSKSIRYAGVINEFGRTLAGTLRPGVRPMLNSEQVKNELFIISTLVTLRKNPAGAIGTLDYMVLRHKKITIVALQKKQMTYYVSVDGKEKHLTGIIRGIKKSI